MPRIFYRRFFFPHEFVFIVFFHFPSKYAVFLINSFATMKFGHSSKLSWLHYTQLVRGAAKWNEYRTENVVVLYKKKKNRKLNETTRLLVWWWEKTLEKRICGSELCLSNKFIWDQFIKLIDQIVWLYLRSRRRAIVLKLWIILNSD